MSTSGSKTALRRGVKMFDQPFPYREFPPLILDAFMEAAYSIKAPDALIATTVIAASAAAIHAEFDVVRPNGMIGPTSIFAMTIAQSGERKSSVDREFFCVFQDFDNRNIVTGKQIGRAHV